MVEQPMQLVELIGLTCSLLSFYIATLSGAANGVGVWLALGILLAAGISDGIGKHSVELITHGVNRQMFAAHVLLRGLVFVLGALVWITAVWITSRTVFGEARPLVQVVRLAGVGYLPLLPSFFMLTPYGGPNVRRLLGAWSVGIVLLLVAQIFDLALWQASVCVLGTAGVIQGCRRLLHPLLAPIDRWLWRVTTGTHTHDALVYAPLALPLATTYRA